ncbi:hypothetical protein N7462_010908 [Penicillium macrosclerotiorum]|uniref:uncharacterized protein n=1 Tax=Penicillium macrosclerotiorum TaxID=303699 RepID=UPI0025487DE8|nr:uncharacterized protein N7462_010908 [Penicillium macrosclerotiorum]KAJ5669838.1 hypothetical protein N7462_010908 [Penicillium macrosclerotiorum]
MGPCSFLVLSEGGKRELEQLAIDGGRDGLDGLEFSAGVPRSPNPRNLEAEFTIGDDQKDPDRRKAVGNSEFSVHSSPNHVNPARSPGSRGVVPVSTGVDGRQRDIITAVLVRCLGEMDLRMRWLIWQRSRMRFSGDPPPHHSPTPTKADPTGMRAPGTFDI